MTITLTDPDLVRDRAYIDGQWVTGADGATFPVTDPADGSVLAKVADCRLEQTRAAIDAADAALPGWRGRTAKERAGILRRWFDLIMENQDDLALLMTSEQGKPLAESRGEVAYGAAFIEWFAEEGKRADGAMIPSPWAN